MTTPHEATKPVTLNGQPFSEEDVKRLREIARDIWIGEAKYYDAKWIEDSLATRLARALGVEET